MIGPWTSATHWPTDSVATRSRSWSHATSAVARVDAFFPDALIVDLTEHGTHSSRQARQRDEQRRTELTRRGNRVITFTHQDLRDRPASIASQLVAAVRMSSAARSAHAVSTLWRPPAVVSRV